MGLRGLELRANYAVAVEPISGQSQKAWTVVKTARTGNMKQPLAAIATNGGAALRFLEQVPPDVEEVRSALKRIVSDSHRTSDVFDGIRALFGNAIRNDCRSM